MDYRFSTARLDAFKPARPWWRIKDSVVLQTWCFDRSDVNAQDVLRRHMHCEELVSAVEKRCVRDDQGHVGVDAKASGHSLLADVAVCGQCERDIKVNSKDCYIRADFAIDPIWCIPGDGVAEVVAFFMHARVCYSLTLII